MKKELPELHKQYAHRHPDLKPIQQNETKGSRQKEDMDAATKSALSLADVLTSPQQKQIEEDENLFEGLTDRQEAIAKLRLRGLSQKAIAQALGVTQPYISKEMSKIKQHLVDTGREVDQDYIVGQSITLYDEVGRSAWAIYASQETETKDKIKALQLVMQARERHDKLLMEVGKLRIAPQQVQLSAAPNPFIEALGKREVIEVSKDLITGTFPKLPDPEPPEEEYSVYEDEDD